MDVGIVLMIVGGVLLVAALVLAIYYKKHPLEEPKGLQFEETVIGREENNDLQEGKKGVQPMNVSETTVLTGMEDTEATILDEDC